MPCTCDVDDRQREEFEKLLRELRLMLQRLDRIVEACLDISYRLVGSSREQVRSRETILEREARHGVHSIHFDIDEKTGRTIVQMGDLNRFALSAKLAHLLAILSIDSDPNPNGDLIIGFKSRSEVAKELGIRMNRTYSSREVSQATHLLRATFRRHNVNPYLIDSTAKGVRLRLVRRTSRD